MKIKKSLMPLFFTVSVLCMEIAAQEIKSNKSAKTIPQKKQTEAPRPRNKTNPDDALDQKIEGRIKAILRRRGLSEDPNKVRVAVCDINRVFENMPEHNEALRRLKQKRDRFDNIRRKKESEISDLFRRLDGKYIYLTEQEKKRLKTEIDEKRGHLLKYIDERNKELAKIEDNEISVLVERIYKIIKKLSDDNKIDIVIDKRKAGVLFAAARVDITGDVIAFLRRGRQVKTKKR